MWACLKIEELRWGSPTATPPFKPLNFAPALKSTSRMRSFIFVLSFTDHTGEPRSLSLPKGPFPNSIFIPSLTHPALKAVFCFRGYASACSSLRVYASVFSVFFRVRPWLVFCFCLFLFPCNSVLIRGKCFCFFFLPWLIFCFLAQPSLTHLALKGNLHR